MTIALTYGPAGATRPEDPRWHEQVPGFRRFERTAVIGYGTDFWETVADGVLRWDIKRRSGFRVMPCRGATDRVAEGAEYRIAVGWGPATVYEPVRVVQVVDLPDRCGFAYGTLPGHPVSGEEAFIVHREPDGTVRLTLRSLTRPAPTGLWRTVFPILLIAQRFYRRRYLRAMLR
ncbi:DUF1990 family protein [Nocardia terpenica]|uniref:DUF1990 domain-containing protein n=1 Tax=Nocardia terpenica TaxID=455432 RepID=A0A164NQM2_9NOCA|nr:DUF1990 domain-containing protein [Nocardia terpenica]KZM74613.1 hypothetical protein AWN90_21255 [Nocardia terpenica]NQE93800.1 DUF1990 domain-containing protein [Nocardia terpenica]